MDANISDPETNVSSDFPFDLQFIDTLEAKLAYVDTGSSTGFSDVTAVFLHGNPASSYLYRNIIPHLSAKVRCIAPDLVGMGSSSKPSIKYTFVQHADYIEEFLDKVVPEGKIIFLIQDWGSALGFDWAFRHQNRIAGLAFMEFIRPFPAWDDLAQGKAQETFKAFRDEEFGRKLIIEQNTFVEAMLPLGLFRTLSVEEKAYYAKPYKTLESREPLLAWANQVPLEGYPVDVTSRVSAYHDWLLQTDLPKLFFWATPGQIVTVEKARWYLNHLKNVQGVFLGKGLHFLEEDHPHRIGQEMSAWLDKVLV